MRSSGSRFPDYETAAETAIIIEPRASQRAARMPSALRAERAAAGSAASIGKIMGDDEGAG
jgi:hypothetical protein